MAYIPSTTTASPTTSDAAPLVIATLALNGTTLTATAVPSTTGLAVLDGTTLTWRQPGITYSNGEAVSLGFNGLVDSTTTGQYFTTTEAGPTGSSVGSVSTGSMMEANVTSSASMTSTADSGSDSGSVASTLTPLSSGGSGQGSVVTTITTSGSLTMLMSGTAASTTQGLAATSASMSTSASGSGGSSSAGSRLSAGKCAVLVSAVLGLAALAF